MLEITVHVQPTFLKCARLIFGCRDRLTFSNVDRERVPLTLIARAEDIDFTVPFTPAMTILWPQKCCQVWWAAYTSEFKSKEAIVPDLVVIRERSMVVNGDTAPKTASKFQ